MLWRTARAGDVIRTHDNNVGNVVLYQLSYTRIRLLNPTATPPLRKDKQPGNRE